MVKKEEDFTAKKGIGQICSQCHKKIKATDRFALLGTYENCKVIEEDFHHIKCWKEYYHEGIKLNETNLKELMKQMAQYKKQFPQIEAMLPAMRDDR